MKYSWLMVRRTVWLTPDQVRVQDPETLEIADYVPFRFDLE